MELAPVFVSLGSASFGYLAKAFVDSKMETKKQKEKEKQFKREKLEKAFMILNDYQNKITSLELVSLSDGEYNSSELTMIIKFYFPNLEVFFGEYVALSSEFSLKLKFDKETEGIEKIYKKYGEMCKLLVEESKKI